MGLPCSAHLRPRRGGGLVQPGRHLVPAGAVAWPQFWHWFWLGARLAAVSLAGLAVAGVGLQRSACLRSRRGGGLAQPGRYLVPAGAVPPIDSMGSTKPCDGSARACSLRPGGWLVPPGLYWLGRSSIQLGWLRRGCSARPACGARRGLQLGLLVSRLRLRCSARPAWPGAGWPAVCLLLVSLVARASSPLRRQRWPPWPCLCFWSRARRLRPQSSG